MIFLILQSVFFCTLLIIVISYWYIQKYGDISIENILFHINSPLKNAPTEILDGISLYIFAAICIFIIFSVYVKVNRKQLGFFCITLISFEFFYVNNHFQLLDFFKKQFTASNFIEQNYVYPKENIIQFPQNKKNLIVIQVESLESSYQDKKNGGLFNKNYIPELTELAKNNISFSCSIKIEGALVLPESGWTIASVVSETAGIPLKLYSDKNVSEIGNTMNKYISFLPNVITLGDILRKEGYNNYFFLGTDKEFAGQGLYFQEHGQYVIFDVNSMKKIKKDKYIYDNDMFQFIKEKLLTEINQKKPWHIFIQTYDTHFGEKNKFSKVSKNISEFIKWVKVQPYYSNTIIVIIGDHFNMNKNDFDEESEVSRGVYNIFINSEVLPVKEKNRLFSTIDIFPTILSALGVKIDGNKLGLGTNLFSQELTILEKYGRNFVFQEISKKSHFYDKKLLVR